MRKSILGMLMVPVFLTVAGGAQLCCPGTFHRILWIFQRGLRRQEDLGVDTRDVTSDRLSDLKLKEEHGVEVTLVDQDAPAGKAGLKEYDVILTINGSQVESVEQLRRMIHEDSYRTSDLDGNQPQRAGDDS